MQCLCYFHQDLRAAMLLTRDLRQTASFEKTPQLARQDGGFSRQVFAEEIRIGAMQKDCRPNNFVRNHERCCHDGARVKFRGQPIAGRIQVICADCLTLPDGFNSNCTLARLEAGAAKALCHHAIGFGADEFPGRVAVPEVRAVDLEELPRGLAELTNQRRSIGTLRSRYGKT